MSWNAGNRPLIGGRRSLVAAIGAPAVALWRGPARRGGVGDWVWRAAMAVAGVATVLSAAVHFMLTMHLYRIPFPQLWGSLAGLLLIIWSLQLLRAPPPDAPRSPDPAMELTEHPFGQADRWRRRLATTSGDVEWFSRVVRDRLREVVAQRLRLRHGVRLAGDPAAAEAVLGRALHEFLTEPLPRTPTPRELEQLITRIEEI